MTALPIPLALRREFVAESTTTSLRILHRPSGATGATTTNRVRRSDWREALLALRDTDEWKAWLRSEVTSASPDPTAIFDPASMQHQILDRHGNWVDVEPPKVAAVPIPPQQTRS